MKIFCTFSRWRTLVLYFVAALIFSSAASAAPLVTTSAATGVGITNATLNGNVDPQGVATTAYFQFGMDAELNSTPVIPNPGFEANGFTVYPGYANVNGGVINGWTLSDPTRIGLNPSGGSPFADNGAIPQGTNVAFIQSHGSANTLSTTLSNLVVGVTYRVSFRANCRTGLVPSATWSLNGGPFVSFTCSPAVGGSSPYYTNSNTFTATTDTAVVSLRNNTSGDSTALIDNFSIVAIYSSISLPATNATLAVSTPLTGLEPGKSYFFRLIASNSVESAIGSVLSFTTSVGVPLVATLSPITITPTNAILRGTANPGGGATAVYFQYGTTTNYGSFTPTNALAATNSVLTTTNAVNLIPGTSYHCQIVASNSAGIAYGTNVTFTAPPLHPVVTTLTATDVISTNALLNADVHPGNGLTAVYFRYGLTTNYGSFSATNLLGATNTSVTVSTLVSNLAPATLYHYCAVATNSSGIAVGSNMSFTTDPGVPTVTTLAATNITTNSAILSGTVNPGGLETQAYFQYGTSTNYGSFTSTTNLAAGATTLSINQLSDLLVPSTVYHYRLVGSNSAGIRAGANITFTTGRLPGVVAVSSSGNSGPGSLRQTILNSLPGDIIAFHPSLSGTRIQLTSGPILLTNTITITSSNLPGGIILDGRGLGRIFQVDASANVVLTALTLTGGMSSSNGGAILNSGTLTLNRCTIAGNVASGASGLNGAVGSNGTPSSPGGNGQAAQGGAIHNTGTLTLNQCTLTGNQAVGGNGGEGGDGGCGFLGSFCWASGNGGAGGNGMGGAIYNGGSLQVNQSTFSGNSATGGTGGAGGTGGLSNGSSGANGSSLAGAIYQAAGSLTLFNSIVAGNSPDNLLGPFSTAGNNLTNGTPNLGSLANNGGPTQTMMILTNSLAWETGAATPFTEDQRGLPRVSGNAPDIGAVELRSPGVNTLPASSITSRTAILNGTVTPNGLAAAVHFELGTTTNYGGFTITNAVTSTNATSAVAIAVTNLQPNTTYYFRIVATSPGVISRGTHLTFVTGVAPPTVTTLSATALTFTNATLQGSVHPSSMAAQVYFEYGTDANYGNFSGVTTLTATNTSQSVSNLIGGLAPGTLYHYRAVALNGAGIAAGGDVTFNTKPLLPAITTLPATVLNGERATLNASVNPGNGVTAVYFVYSSDPAFTNVMAGGGTIFNHSFESNNFTVSPGYATNNGGVITGWTLSNASRIGLNPAGDSPFANNGAIPQGSKVAFIQSINSTNRLSTTISNLVVGGTYRVSFRANSRASYPAPGSTWSLNGGPFVPFTSYPAVGGLNPYYTNSNVFVATNDTAVLALQNFSSTDTTVLLDNFSVEAGAVQFSVTNSIAPSFGDVPVAITVTNLQPFTTYHFQAVAINSSGKVIGELLTFTTPGTPSIVTTLPATEVTSNSATLNGIVDARDTAGRAYFEYGLSTNYGSFTTTNLVPTNTTIALSHPLSDLTSGEQYHFRIVGENDGNVILGEDQTFKPASGPTVTPLTATVLGTNAGNGLVSVRLSALVRPQGDATTVAFEYGKTTTYFGTYHFGSVPGGILESNVAPVLSFSPGSTYHWRVVVGNSAGSAATSDQTFSLGNGSGIPGDLNGDGIVSQEELDAVYGNYLTNSPWLNMTNVAGLGNTNVSFQLGNSTFGGYSVQYSTNLTDWFLLGPATPRYLFIDTNAPTNPQRYYRLVYP